MRFLVADSGSSTCEWCLFKTNPLQVLNRQTTRGLNPVYESLDSITDELSQHLNPEILSAEQLVFYGAGCAGESALSRIGQALGKVFPDIPIHVESDLLGAARALFADRRAICCILGTGSNSCYYDGTNITDQIQPLGFVLGDEGSAASLGRQLLKSFFYREMPRVLSAWLEEHHDMQRDSILEAIRTRPDFNTFVASFSLIFSIFPEDPWLAELIRKELGEFLDRHVLKYHMAHKVPVGFVGSVAFHHQGVLSELLTLRRLTPGPMLISPVEQLVQYHSSVSE